MMINRILILFFAATLVLFCSGCFTMMTWNNTGQVITHVENIRAEYTGPEELTVHSTGWQEMAFPFDGPRMGYFPWEQHIVLPLTRMPDEQTNQMIWVFGVDPREKRRFYKTESGLWSMQEGQSYTIHPDDIPHLSEPYIASDYWRLIIPLEVRKTKDRMEWIDVTGYEAHVVPYLGETRRCSDGVGIRICLTICRCCLLPVPIVLDAATFPIQAYVYLLCIMSDLSDA